MKKSTLGILLIAGLLVLSGCATTSGLPAQVSTSGFDGSKEVAIKPHAACVGLMDNCVLAVGAHWTSRVPENAVLDLTLFGSYAGLRDLMINIDGNIITLSPKELTNFDSGSNFRTSQQSYLTNLDTIKLIVNSKKTWIKVYTSNNDYIETPIIDNGQDSYALNALKRFLAEVPN